MRRLLGEQPVDGLVQPLLDLLLGDAFFLGPVRNRQVEPEDTLHLLLELGGLPLLGIDVLGDGAGHHAVDHVAAHAGDDLGDVLGRHQLDALLVDLLALAVHDVVEAQQVLADLEVARLDLALRRLERLVEPAMGQRLVVGHALLLHPVEHLVVAEDAHQVVFQRQEELRCTRVALAARAAAQLVVDAPALVALGTEDVKAADLQHPLLFRDDFSADLVGLRVIFGRGPITSMNSLSVKFGAMGL